MFILITGSGSVFEKSPPCCPSCSQRTAGGCRVGLHGSSEKTWLTALCGFHPIQASAVLQTPKLGARRWCLFGVNRVIIYIKTLNCKAADDVFISTHGHNSEHRFDIIQKTVNGELEMMAFNYNISSY